MRGAQGKAGPRQGDPRDPGRQEEAAEGRAQRDRRGRRALPGQAPHQDQRRRRGDRVRRRGLHRRRRGHRHPDARRLAQARARGQGSVGDPAARGRRHPGGHPRLDEGADRDSSRTRAARTSFASTTCPPRPATASRCRSCSTSATASGSSARWPSGGAPKGALAVAVSKGGFGLRFNLDPHRELSTRAGRRFAKLGDGDEIVGVALAGDKDVLCVVTSDARALLCKADELPDLANPGRGVTVIKAGRRRRRGRLRRRRPQGQGRPHRRDRRRQGAAGRSGSLQPSPAAAARGTRSSARRRSSVRPPPLPTAPPPCADGLT